MSDVRARLADVLSGAWERWMTAEADDHDGQLDGPLWTYVADVLLSLPGIAIVELPKSADDSGDWPCVGIGTEVWINPLTGFVRFQTNQFDPEGARSVAAALLAAANAAEQATP